MSKLNAALSVILCLATLSFPAMAGKPGPRIALGEGKTLTGRFVHERPLEGLAQPLRMEGSFTVAGASGLTWAIEKPMATTTLLSNGVLTQKIGPYQILQITPSQMPFLAGAEEQIRAALSGNWEKLSRDYVVARKGDEKAWIATLTPRVKKGKPFRKIVARGGLFVDSVEISLPKEIDRVLFSEQRLVETINP